MRVISDKDESIPPVRGHRHTRAVDALHCDPRSGAPQRISDGFRRMFFARRVILHCTRAVQRTAAGSGRRRRRLNSFRDQSSFRIVPGPRLLTLPEERLALAQNEHQGPDELPPPSTYGPKMLSGPLAGGLPKVLLLTVSVPEVLSLETSGRRVGIPDGLVQPGPGICPQSVRRPRGHAEHLGDFGDR
jgi:hypothetical protein